MTNDRYIVAVRTHAGGGGVRNAVSVRLYDTQAGGTEWHWARRLTPGIVKEWKNLKRFSINLQNAMTDANELAAELNAREVQRA